MISLADYRGNSPVLLGLFPGLYCPFCRRSIAQMAATSEKLKPLGVESIAVVGTELDNARLYYQYRPTRMTMGADPQLSTHRSYGVPRPEPTPEMLEMVMSTRINPTGELPEPLAPPVAVQVLNERDGFQMTPVDVHESQTAFTQMKGQFLIDTAGIVRWANVECEKEGLPGLGKFPSHEELMAAARLVT
jgi:thiol-disulfide isomerase/thioredoxin